MKIHSSSMKSGLTLSSDSILGPLTSDLPAEGLDLSEVPPDMKPVELTIDNPHVNWGKIDMLMKRFLHIRLRSLQKKIGVIGDGLLTPAISVFSAVSGLEVSMSKKHHQCCDYHYLLHTGVFIFKAAKGLQRQSLPQQLCNFY